MESPVGQVLTALARNAVETGFAPRPPHAAELVERLAPHSMCETLERPAATFVTLERRRRLRGCIGTLTALRPLAADVVRNARHAARDPRMAPVEAAELPELTVTVAVLSAPDSLAVPSFSALFELLRPGTDGLTLHGTERRKATFLPSVWHALREPERFVTALLRKGGWPRALWSADLRSVPWPEGLAAERYTTESFSARRAA
ncbi:AmmeMemoRadiSam system protein A [Glycomyces sp. L485]|uniref:AmmeMemoRadiSam system protein A n=1 Tax=Glycomyces sp. L485 TaxID=2909235 RepID=UPI001F4B4585|nr:AmmeMemoRadiSam system protein A [Glycomyces sp. L485]MCH7231679.1 AmmeMemoRadiSam system protein A [Glycomyces sp. L485]